MTATATEQRKLILRIDGDVIDQGKKYAASTNISLSRLIENYLRAVVKRPEPKPIDELRLTPWVREFYGILRDCDVNEQDYYDYLEEKYS